MVNSTPFNFSTLYTLTVKKTIVDHIHITYASIVICSTYIPKTPNANWSLSSIVDQALGGDGREANPDYTFCCTYSLKLVLL
jgi:hypothetical protein